MNFAINSEFGVDLVSHPDFRVGAAHISPSSCEIQFDGRSHKLQPRIMQVFVLLASLEGSVASKEELIQNCWQGAAVTDDVITRCISRLRSLAVELGGEVFTIKTVPRVGYAMIQHCIADTPDVPDGASDEKLGIQGLKGIRSTSFNKIAMAVGALAAGGSFLFAVLSTGNSEWSLQEARYLSSDPDTQSHPAVSPDEKFVVYSSFEGSDNRDLWMRPAGGGEPLRLTTHPDFDHHPSYAPDGNRIAFVRSKFGGEPVPCRIIIKDLSDSSERIVSRCKTSSFGLSTPAWSADGNALYLSQSVGNEEDSVLRLVKLDLLSGDVTEISNPPDDIRGDLDPVLSPDNTQMLFRRAITLGSGNLFALDLTSGEETQITSNDRFRSYAWTPDGENIVTITNDDQKQLELFSRSGELVRSEPSGLLGGTGRMARGGNLLATESSFRQTKIVEQSGTGERELAVVRGTHYLPRYSVGGDLAFFTLEENSATLWVSEGDSAPLRITTIPRLGAMAWSPDGKEIAFAPDEGGYIGTYDLSSEQIMRLEWGEGAIGSLAWDPAGDQLVVANKSRGEWHLWKIQADGSRAAQRWGETGWWAVRSNSSGMFAASSKKPGIWKLAPDGSPIELVEASYSSGQEIGRTLPSRNAFQVTETQLYYRLPGQTMDEQDQIMVKALTSDSLARKELELDQPFTGFDVSRDGRIAYVRHRSSYNIALLRFVQE